MDLITRRDAAKTLAFLGFGFSAAASADESSDCDDCHRGNGCLVRIGLRGKGEIKYQLEPPVECRFGSTAFGTGAMELTLDPTGFPCDELGGMIPPGSKLNTTIHVLHRKDDLAFLCGRFGIRDSQEELLFEGDINLLHRVNTHFGSFGEKPCDLERHLQGWLSGMRVVDAEKKPLLRAMLVARTEPVAEGAEGYRCALAQIIGVVIESD